MGGRKPPKATFESWVDRQIREGEANGVFDDLPRGPLDLSDDHDDGWWLKRKISDEGLDVLPPSLVLRRDIERAVREARSATTEEEARQRIEAVNDRIRAANRVAIAGPPVTLVVYDVDELVEVWHVAHRPTADPRPVQQAPSPPPRGRRSRVTTRFRRQNAEPTPGR